jgi:ethanolamine ammonia-lyase large subunit
VAVVVIGPEVDKLLSRERQSLWNRLAYREKRCYIFAKKNKEFLFSVIVLSIRGPSYLIHQDLS